MSNKYTWALFDLDGTLSDPYEGITKSFINACNKMNYKAPEKEKLRLIIGPPLKFSFIEYCHMTEEEAKMAIKIYRERYSTIGIFENKLYDGIDEVLKGLKERGVKISLATSKPEEYAIRILERFEIKKYFDFISGDDLKQSRGTKDDVIRYAIDNCNIDTKTSIMIGDRKYDIESGNKFGLDTLGVLYGYGTKEELVESNSKYLAYTPKDILTFF